MRKYITTSGDMWDSIAFSEMGSEMFKDRLMTANRRHRYTYIFPAGVELLIPETVLESEAGLPPWRQRHEQ